MDAIKKWLEDNYSEQFVITKKNKDLELDPKDDILYGCYLKEICKAIEVFGKSMFIKAELKRGIYIVIW